MLGLRTVDSERKSYNGSFQWPPLGGTAIAPDWDGGKAECGGGLHFLPWGEGDGDLLDWSDTAIWQVVDDHDAKDTVLFDKRAKARELTVVFEGDRKGATDYILTHGAKGRAVVGATVIAGDYKTAIAGDGGMAITGDNGKAIVSKYGTAIAGDYGMSIAAHIMGTAIVGDYGMAFTEEGGKAKAGIGGTLIISNRYGLSWRVMVAYVGKDGILPDVFYTLNNKDEFVRIVT